MHTRYPISRVVATMLGLWAGVILIGTVLEFIGGRPEGCFVKSYGGSWADPHPEISFVLALAWESLSFGGTLLMWFRPRLGYFVAAMGYQLYMTLGLVDYFSIAWVTRDLETSGWVLRFYALPVWLFWLCVKDEPQAATIVS